MEFTFQIVTDESDADDIVRHYFIARPGDEMSVLVDGVETLYVVRDDGPGPRWTRAGA